ncbi:MAG TPA: flagellar regulator YcgR PilZN domain-containing protein [Castellaniella sp.]|uniref:flagellar brake protein n=1 Tax=Castellaniella sp. TaxID=1955812 RepID=UPI002EEFBAC3
MAIEEDDPYVVSQPLEIQAIVNNLLSKRVLVRLDVPHHAVSIISTLLDVDRKFGTILLDNASDQDINDRLLRAPLVRLQGMLDRVLIEFTGRLAPAFHGGRPAFSMAQPPQLRRMQRRESFRIDIPNSAAATSTIDDASLSKRPARFRLMDLSTGGVKLADDDNILEQSPVGTIFSQCSLDLPDFAPIPVSLRLLRHSQLIQGNGKTLHAAACRFFNLPANRQITIQQYVSSLERAAMARRWGIE